MVVEIDRSAGVERLARHWAALREANDGRRHLLVHLVRARRGTGEAERRAAWDFVAARMDDDLARAGRRRPRGWDVVRLEWGP